MPETVAPLAPPIAAPPVAVGRGPRRPPSPWTVLRYAAVLAGAVVMLFPFLWTLVTSITPEGSLAGGPTLLVRNPTLAAYRTLLDTLPMWRIVANSLWVAVVSTVLQLVTGSMAAYGLPG
jgi:multiple sugar transport system permease protein